VSTVFERVSQRIDGYRDVIIDLERRLTAVKALGPENDGEGEVHKAELLLEILGDIGFTDVEVHKAPDDRVPCGYRPNIVARRPGKDRSRTLWLMSHMDVVPPGDLKHWSSDPWEVRGDGAKLYGRGVEDNQQGMVASLCLARALHEEGLEPAMNLGLLLVADEETGNALGIDYLLENHDIFCERDLIVVPDGGEPDGSMIEVAEKGIIWFKLTVKGKSTHGSTPERGVNAHLAGAHVAIALAERLHEKYVREDAVFDPPISTFAPTKVEAGAPSVNTIPGEHVFYMDCRVLPGYSLDDVAQTVERVSARVDHHQGSQTIVETIQRMDSAPPTAVDAPVVKALEAAVKTVYGVDARPMGIGGGTVAARIRTRGFPAAVWARMDETMHGPDEYTILDNIIGDAKVFAHILLSE
jgi:succinyl-diaminopimelate desuccinylase